MSPRWVAIRTSAVISLLGSGLMLLMTTAMVFSAFFAPEPPGAHESPIPMKALLVGCALMFLTLAGWGIATGIAIFLRRRWSRISILIFAGLLAFTSAGGMAMAAIMELPPTPESSDLPAGFNTALRLGMVALYGLLTAIGIWWLILFTRARTKEYYGGPPAVTSGRPLSISIIGWVLLITGILALPGSLLRFPLVLFGVLLTGRLALALCVVLGLVYIVLGRGLLRRREPARLGAIGLCVLLGMSNLVGMIHPGYPELMRQAQAAVQQLIPAVRTNAWPGSTGFTPGLSWFYGAIGLAFCVAPIYFLMRRRADFAATSR